MLRHTESPHLVDRTAEVVRGGYQERNNTNEQTECCSIVPSNFVLHEISVQTDFHELKHQLRVLLFRSLSSRWPPPMLYNSFQIACPSTTRQQLALTVCNRLTSQQQNCRSAPSSSCASTVQSICRSQNGRDAYPTLPSICNSISLFISTAYSIGSSFTSGSMKPVTIIDAASASVMPRLIR